MVSVKVTCSVNDFRLIKGQMSQNLLCINEVWTLYYEGWILYYLRLIEGDSDCGAMRRQGLVSLNSALIKGSRHQNSSSDWVQEQPSLLW